MISEIVEERTSRRRKRSEEEDNDSYDDNDDNDDDDADAYDADDDADDATTGNEPTRKEVFKRKAPEKSPWSWHSDNLDEGGRYIKTCKPLRLF